MSADILQFLPRANPKADRAFWKGAEPYGEKLLGLMSSADREAILRAGAVEIESVRVVTPTDSAPETGDYVFETGDYVLETVRDMRKDDSFAGYELEPLELPKGMTWEMARKAQEIIEDWEETPGVSDLDLVMRLYRLFRGAEHQSRGR